MISKWPCKFVVLECYSEVAAWLNKQKQNASDSWALICKDYGGLWMIITHIKTLKERDSNKLFKYIVWEIKFFLQETWRVKTWK